MKSETLSLKERGFLFKSEKKTKKKKKQDNKIVVPFSTLIVNVLGVSDERLNYIRENMGGIHYFSVF